MPNVTTSKWEAWVDVMPGGKPSLHVTAEVDTHSTDMAILEKKVSAGNKSKNIAAGFKDISGTKPEINPQQVKYTEEVDAADKYEEVEVFYDGKSIAQIKDIKVVH